MKVYTSYFANLKKVPKDAVAISICAKAPDWYKGEQYKRLAPSYSLLTAWKATHDERMYVSIYDSFLKGLSQQEILKDLSLISRGKDVVLVCFEKSGSFCHRNLVLNWLKEAGVEGSEL
jgi:uncharacterized protein YeaO (DUF488 family)